ncbi:hypothetical protein [Longimicrobium terrae]|uniref:Uncharacterized protein n=1 Tax=Longimicrobium terrae TaxID=1639882 RepID=A0A841GZD8_9BACT|nr:hypothetical protein [Longimicrobium terrae]MBB4636879.1 hypothetical protein [Longimicrobium terrae]MBB6071122.1 hypothetical protein [Longimicrobium terrae]NNC29171.1 hypothetical protein [Longimicrobium terrae]
MKVTFGRAHHGWLPVTLELDDGPFPFDVSYMPYDFVSELVAALHGVLSGPGEYVARICEEPVEHDWRFRSFDPSAVIFEVVTYRWGRRPGEKGEVTVKQWGTPLEMVLPLWRGLRDLAGRARAEGYRSHWDAPFPFDALDRLTTRVEHACAEHS